MRTLACLTIVAASVALFCHPTPADACGGTFCDAGNPAPVSAAVDQTGETIVFVLEIDHVEAHIRIEYDPTTEAQAFAWIVPVLGTPEFEVGSQQLFTALLDATVPSYGYDPQPDPCGNQCLPGGSISSTGTSSSGGSMSGGQTTGVDESGGTDVVFEDTVGAFDVVVLDAPSAAELMTWLGENGYYQDPTAEPILQQYVDEGAQFAAFRLTQGAGVGEIHPIVIRYAGQEPCIPIRLTRIAARDDMDIRALFLGESRTVPTNWRHVVPNPVAIDWLSLGGNWKSLVTLAVDTPVADGHAWVTEYAGTSLGIPTGQLWSRAWNGPVFETLAPEDVVDTLADQFLLYCDFGTCQFYHPLVLGILRRWLPAPAAVPEQEFYSCVSCYADQIDMMVWDGAAFAQAIADRIVEPGAHAVEVVQAHSYLTRLYTTISPPEMTEDPLFGVNPSLGNVDLRGQLATQNIHCNGAQDVDVPGGHHVELWTAGVWPNIEGMPAVLRIEELPLSGAPVVLVDNATIADQLLSAWNAQFAEDPPAGTSTCGSDSSESSGSLDEQNPHGCNCNATRGSTASWLLLTLLGATPRRSRRV